MRMLGPKNYIMTFNGIDFGSKPDDDCLEIIIFGPGYGESICMHLGDQHWMVVDSCFDTKTKEPFALEYLKSINVDYENDVKLLVATHWHDDHCQGISACLEKFTSAKFCMASALTKKQFLQFVERFNATKVSESGSKTSEMQKIFDLLHERKSSIRPVMASEGKTIYQTPNRVEDQCNFNIKVTALSPSDKAEQMFLKIIASEMPVAADSHIAENTSATTKRSAPDITPNEASIALWVEVNGIKILLGADLENLPATDRGWKAIVNSEVAPLGQACIFKIPHHGSITGDNEDVWKKFVEANAICLVTPWGNGGHLLPKETDLKRIWSKTNQAYITSNRRSVNGINKKPSIVRKELQNLGINTYKLRKEFGAIRARKNINDTSKWVIERFGAAHLLEESEVA